MVINASSRICCQLSLILFVIWCEVKMNPINIIQELSRRYDREQFPKEKTSSAEEELAERLYNIIEECRISPTIFKVETQLDFDDEW